MFRYLAWIWDANNEASALEASGLARRMRERSSWVRTFTRPGIDVYVTGGRARSAETYALARGSGVILGKLFTRRDGVSHETPLTLSSEATRDVMGQQGRALVASYWGRYVAFLYDADDAAIRVLRGPCGSLPCLSVRHGGLQLYCSWMDDLALIGVESWRINWTVVGVLLCSVSPDFRQTAVAGLSQVLGGECVTHRGEKAEHTFYWDPVRATELQVDLPTAAQRLRACVVDVVRAWRACHEHVLQTLSGGLDSSIIAASQSRSEQESTVFVNYYLPDSDSDEREFSHLVARHLRVELIEWQRDPLLSLRGLLRMQRAPFPTTCLHLLEMSQREADFCAQHGATAVFGGHGGDQVFYTGRGVPCAASYLDRGRRIHAGRVILDAAYRDRLSVWQVCRELRELRVRPLTPLLGMQLGQYQTLMDRDFIVHVQRAQPVWMHPLLRHPVGVDTARLVHAEHVLTPDDGYDIFCSPNYPDRISPLLSQPLVELCLSLPRHLLIAGGWTRAVARRAFQKELPYAIVTRRDKGSVREQIRSVLRCNVDFVREMLLDGELIKQKILKREQVEAALAGDPTRTQARAEELATVLCATAWLRQFESLK